MSTPATPDPSHVSSSEQPDANSVLAGRSMTGSFQYQPMTFLGMSFDAEETKQLWDSILKSVSSQISKDNEKARKTIRNFGKVPGDPDYED